MSQVKSLSEKLMTPNSKQHKAVYRSLELLEGLFEDVVADTDDDIAVDAALDFLVSMVYEFVDNYVFNEDDI